MYVCITAVVIGQSGNTSVSGANISLLPTSTGHISTFIYWR